MVVIARVIFVSAASGRAAARMTGGRYAAFEMFPESLQPRVGDDIQIIARPGMSSVATNMRTGLPLGGFCWTAVDGLMSAMHWASA